MFSAAVSAKRRVPAATWSGVWSVVGICSNQLDEELGVLQIFRGGIVGRSFSVDDATEQIRESVRLPAPNQ